MDDYLTKPFINEEFDANKEVTITTIKKEELRRILLHIRKEILEDTENAAVKNEVNSLAMMFNKGDTLYILSQDLESVGYPFDDWFESINKSGTWKKRTGVEGIFVPWQTMKDLKNFTTSRC
jgi:hypothetical protein